MLVDHAVHICNRQISLPGLHPWLELMFCLLCLDSDFIEEIFSFQRVYRPLFVSVACTVLYLPKAKHQRWVWCLGGVLLLWLEVMKNPKVSDFPLKKQSFHFYLKKIHYGPKIKRFT